MSILVMGCHLSKKSGIVHLLGNLRRAEVIYMVRHIRAASGVGYGYE